MRPVGHGGGAHRVQGEHDGRVAGRPGGGDDAEAALVLQDRLRHDCAALLRKVTGLSQIHGVHQDDLVDAMALAGWRCDRAPHPRTARPTLAAWLRAHDTFAHPFILVVRNHYVALADGEIADSGWLFRRRPMPVADAPHRRVLVRETIACRPSEPGPRTRRHPRRRSSAGVHPRASRPPGRRPGPSGGAARRP